MKNNLDFFNKVLIKGLDEGFDIHEIFMPSYFDIPNKEAVLADLARHLIIDLKIYTYPGMEEKIAQEPMLKTTYLAEQLNNTLKNNGDGASSKKVKL